MNQSILAVLVLTGIASSVACNARNADTTNEESDIQSAGGALGSNHFYAIEPKQCFSNPWDQRAHEMGGAAVMGVDDEAPGPLVGELGTIHEWLIEQGANVDLLGFLVPGEPMVTCASCDCPRGDTLVVHATTGADGAALARLGFEPLRRGVTIEPIQCNDNPWASAGSSVGGFGEFGGGDDERTQLASWAAEQDAPTDSVGFLASPTAGGTCEACSCTRGDVALAVPSNDASSAKLVALGWKSIADSR